MINNRFNVVYHLLYSVFISIFVKKIKIINHGKNYDNHDYWRLK